MKNRAQWLILACLGLAALVGFDNFRSGGEGEKPALPAGSKQTSGDHVAPEPQTAKAGAIAANEEQDGQASDELEIENPLASFDKDDLKDTVERPLFAMSRRRPPVIAPGKAGQQVAKVPPAIYELLGVINDGHHAIALLRRKGDGTHFRVEVGDTVGGWRVAKLERTSIELLGADGTSQIVKLSGP